MNSPGVEGRRKRQINIPDNAGEGAGRSVHVDGRQREVRVGVVGCGYWGSKHVRVLSATPGVSEIALIDPDLSLCTGLQRVFPATRLFPRLEAALPHVDALVIATPPQTHARLASAAVLEGKHVLVEKPLATSLIDAQLLVDQAQSTNAIVMVGHTFQFNPAVRELRRRLAAGELGEIYYIHSARLNLGLYRPDVNVVWDLAPHDVSILNYLLDSQPDGVAAWGDALAFGDVHDLAYIRLEYRHAKVTGYAHLSWLDPRKTRTVTVVGSEKMAIYDDLAEERLRIYNRGLDSSIEGTLSHERPPAYRYGEMIAPHIRPDEPLAVQDKHFIDSILTQTQPETGGASGIAVVAVLDAIERSMQQRKLVRVETLQRSMQQRKLVRVENSLARSGSSTTVAMRASG